MNLSFPPIVSEVLGGCR